MTSVAAGPNSTYTYNYYGYLYQVRQDPYQYGGETRDLGIFVDDTITLGSRATLRHNTNKLIDIAIGKRFYVGGAEIKIDGIIYNVLNNDAVLFLADTRLNAGDVFVPDSWVLPRRLMIKLGFDF